MLGNGFSKDDAFYYELRINSVLRVNSNKLEVACLVANSANVSTFDGTLYSPLPRNIAMSQSCHCCPKTVKNITGVGDIGCCAAASTGVTGFGQPPMVCRFPIHAMWAC